MLKMAQAYFLVFFYRFDERKQTIIDVMFVCRLKGLSISRIGRSYFYLYFAKQSSKTRR